MPCDAAETLPVWHGSPSAAWGIPGGTSSKEAVSQRKKRRGFNPRVGKIPWRRAWQPTPVLLAGKPHEQRSLVGYRPRGCKEPNMTEASEHTCGSLEDDRERDPSDPTRKLRPREVKWQAKVSRLAFQPQTNSGLLTSKSMFFPFQKMLSEGCNLTSLERPHKKVKTVSHVGLSNQTAPSHWIGKCYRRDII